MIWGMKRLIYNLRGLIWGQKWLIRSLNVYLRCEMTKYLQGPINISQGQIWNLRGPKRADWRSERDDGRFWKADFRPKASEGRLKACEVKYEALKGWLRSMESDLYLERADLMFMQDEIWLKMPLGLQIRPEKADLGPLWQDLRSEGGLPC